MGGNYNHNQNNGLFYFNGNNNASNTNGNIGSRIHLYSVARSVVGLLSSLRHGCSAPLGENLPLREWFSTLARAWERPLGRNGDSVKRASHLFEKVISDENIDKAIDEVNKSHRWTGNHKPNKTVLWVETTKSERRAELRQIVVNGFEPSEPKVKQRYDRNAKKWRAIAEPKLYPDQYVHHMLIQVFEPIAMRGMDAHCCGSIKGRGTHYGVKRIKKWMKRGKGDTKWCAEVDIYHFYQSLGKDAVLERIRHLVKDFRFIDLVDRCLKFGVLIGAYFSQWFANTILQPLDVIIRNCGVTHYLRYIDNFTIFARNKRVLRKAIKAISEWLNGIGLRLKGDWQYFRVRKRLPNALGYRFGRAYTLIRKHRLLTIKRQIKSFYKSRREVTAKFAMSLISRLSGLKHCNSQNIYKKTIPKGLQKTLKDIIRTYQQRELIGWEICLLQYARRGCQSS